MVAGTYPSPSHIVMTWRSSASDASARTSRIMLVYTSVGTEWMFRKYEKLSREIRRGGRRFRLLESGFTDGQSDHRSCSRSRTSARQLRHIALLGISAPQSELLWK